MVYAVIGSNYGDEGKGLVAAYLTDTQKKTLGIRHNGGAQSGHTVEDENKRFVFHEIASGAFFGADTYWAKTYMPDIYKLQEEIEDFNAGFGFIPLIFVSADSCITTIDDVLINMLLEQSREVRHGSCGMGINEADLRVKAGFGINFRELGSMETQELFERLKKIRNQYSSSRIKELRLSNCKNNEYFELLQNEGVLYNYAATVTENLKYVEIVNDEKKFFQEYETIIFESGQGLRLDAEFQENWPHVTASRTGLTNIIDILDEAGMKLDEVIYVTRSYVTKHGAGPLANEQNKLDITVEEDKTNIPNPWQGEIRYSQHSNISDLLKPIIKDRDRIKYDVITSLFVTHLNESKDRLLFLEGDITTNELVENSEITDEIQNIYLSYSPYVKRDIKMIKIN